MMRNDEIYDESYPVNEKIENRGCALWLTVMFLCIVGTIVTLILT